METEACPKCEDTTGSCACAAEMPQDNDAAQPEEAAPAAE